MKRIIIFVLLISAGSLHAEELTGKAILERVDGNMVARNRRVTSTMIIEGRRGTRTLQARSWVQGVEKAFTEYLSPPREKGTKMLKLQDQLWIYSPATDRTIKIAGHMLRRSLMGSDVSYEDYMEDPKLSNIYDAKLVGVERVQGRDCYLLDLTAKKENVAYYRRKIWIDKDRYLPLQENRFAKRGNLLKTFVINEVFKIEDRWYPKKMTFKDVMLKGSGTKFIIDSVEFDVEIPKYVFSKASLRR
ncbi:MAG: outer membrane lipoprotein-sorting protein [Deltaproteobacteria bacterium]|nr:outer membrane lipoprotein-sorting protein [Deltaproteobacteria bacterium]MBW2010600.1 outer membrane lipoprotein-sorting protein [Deltaproteobacteria bacterium]